MLSLHGLSSGISPRLELLSKQRASTTARAANDKVNFSAEIGAGRKGREAEETLFAVADPEEFADEEHLESDVEVIERNIPGFDDELHQTTSSGVGSTKRDLSSLKSTPPLQRPGSQSLTNNYSTRSAPIQDIEPQDPIFLGAVAIGVVGTVLFVLQTSKAKRGSDVGNKLPGQVTDKRISFGVDGAIPEGLTGFDFSADNNVDRDSVDAMRTIGNDATPFVSSSPREIRGEFKRQLRSMMSDIRRYSTVDLHGRNLGDDGTSYVSGALAFNDAALCLDMSANGISERGVNAICEALQNNTCLEMLSLSSNNLQDSGTSALATYLETDTSINTLNLNSCGIGDLGATALANMLKKNTSLTALELNNNSIDYEGTCAIAEALAENSTLEMLSISGNYVGSLGASALANGLINNSGIKGLMLNGNDIGNIGRSLCLLLLFSFACFSLNSRYHVTALCIILYNSV
jgi:hypothetical protein|tara:strand:- start:1255 stop:2640 length:1386 start_codon:yes stop_codon:yes gene_type:complete